MKKTSPGIAGTCHFPVERLAERAAENGYGEIGSVTELIPEKERVLAAFPYLTIRGSTGNAKIEGEYAIRKFLNPQDLRVNLKTARRLRSLGCFRALFLSCAFYEGESLLGYEIIGGGYGHGRGLSQNGARKWQRKGKPF
ncbi:MAG: hypothetical protein ACLR6B_01885 [Blautia sp.]